MIKSNFGRVKYLRHLARQLNKAGHILFGTALRRLRHFFSSFYVRKKIYKKGKKHNVFQEQNAGRKFASCALVSLGKGYAGRLPASSYLPQKHLASKLQRRF